MSDKVLVSIAGKEGPVHPGHIELINYAKSFGDVTIRIAPKFRSWSSYVLTGRRDEESEDLTEMINSIESLGVSVLVADLPVVDEEARKATLEDAAKWVDLYKNTLVFERYRSLALTSLAGAYLREISINTYQKVVRGPDVISFFLKSVFQLLGASKERIIMPTMVKDPNAIRYQSTTERLPVKFQSVLLELKTIMDDVRPAMRRGRNNKLVDDLNREVCKDKEWSVFEAAVFEGGVIEGKIEVLAFSFPTDNKGGHLIIEEVDYHP